jgi:hypothetical protein
VPKLDDVNKMHDFRGAVSATWSMIIQVARQRVLEKSSKFYGAQTVQGKL